MKRVAMLIGLVLLLGACGSKDVIKDNEFTFSEDDFKEAYEEANDRNFPDNIVIDKSMINVDFASDDDVIKFLKASNEILDYKEIQRLSESIEKEEDHIPTVVNNDDITITRVDSFEDQYSVSIYPDPNAAKE